MRSSNVTLKDVALMADVSKATVSLVINGSPKVNARTSAKVWSIIRDLRYEPSPEARKLAQRRWELPGRPLAQAGPSLSASQAVPPSQVQ